MAKVSIVAVAIGMVSVHLQAQWIEHKAVGIPRTADGKPDLAAPSPKAA